MIEQKGPGGVGNSYGQRSTNAPARFIDRDVLKPEYVGFERASWTSALDEAIKLQALTRRSPPEKVVIPEITGNTRFIDPTWGGPFNGTYSQPYNSPTQATLAAGDGLLFKAGTTTTVSSHIFPAVTGTSVAPIIYGVYDPVTGERLMNVVGAATIISTDALGAVFIFGSGKDYICVDGLKLKAASVNTFGVIDSNGGLHSRITNCEIYEGGFAGIRVYGNGHVIQGNTLRNNGGAGAYVYQIGNIPSNATIQYNSIYGNALSGVYVWDSGGAAVFTGTIACNSLSNNGADVFGRCGVSILNGGGSPKIYLNRIEKSPSGVGVDGVGSSSRDFSGTVIEDNYITDCGEFGVSVSAAKGNGIIQRNTIINSGSFDGGITPGTTRRYSRAIELYGLTTVLATRDWIVRNNYISGAFSWLSDGSEGVGIGLDDNTRNVSVYGNYVTLCEGNAIQVNRGFGNRIYSNILVDNLITPPSRNVAFTGAFAAQIFYIGTPWIVIHNNTIVLTGERENQNQEFGIAENTFVASPNAKVLNNLIVGAKVSGMKLGAVGVESYNLISDTPHGVVGMSNQELTLGTGSRLVARSALKLQDSFFRLGIQTVGATVPGDSQSFDGVPFPASQPQISALLRKV